MSTRDVFVVETAAQPTSTRGRSGQVVASWKAAKALGSKRGAAKRDILLCLREHHERESLWRQFSRELNGTGLIIDGGQKKGTFYFVCASIASASHSGDNSLRVGVGRWAGACAPVVAAGAEVGGAWASRDRGAARVAAGGFKYEVRSTKYERVGGRKSDVGRGPSPRPSPAKGEGD